VRVGNGLALVDDKVLIEDLEDLGWMVKSVEVKRKDNQFFVIKRAAGVKV
jgi:hypothetical protein